MKICLPIDLPNGQESHISPSFEKAEYYIIYDSINGKINIIDDRQKSLEQSKSDNSLTEILPEGAEAIVTNGLRLSAFVVLKRRGILMFKAQSNVAVENMYLFKNGFLKELTVLDLKQGKNCGGSCGSCSSTCS